MAWRPRMDDRKRNYILLFLDPVLFVNAMAFISINAVIPNFLNDLGASIFQISLASALVSIGAFMTQPIFAQMAMGLPVKTIVFSRLLFIQRFLLLAYALCIPVLSAYDYGITVVLFLIFWGIFNAFVGCYSPFYMSILAKVIPGNQRGRLQGFGGAAGNILAIGVAFLTGILLKYVVFPYNYTWIFGIGAFLLILDAGIFALVREESETTQKKSINYFRYIREIPHALKEQKGYAASVLGNSFLTISNVALSFYSLAAIRNFEAGPEQIALFTGIGVMVSILGSSVFGMIGDRLGHRYVLMSTALFSMLAAVVILCIHSLSAVYTAFALSSLSISGYNISSGMNVIAYAPEGQIPLYVSMNMMITLIASSLVTLLAGAVIDALSFAPLFAFTGACAAAGFYTFYVANKKPKESSHKCLFS